MNPQKRSIPSLLCKADSRSTYDSSFFFTFSDSERDCFGTATHICFLRRLLGKLSTFRASRGIQTTQPSATNQRRIISYLTFVSGIFVGDTEGWTELFSKGRMCFFPTSRCRLEKVRNGLIALEPRTFSKWRPVCVEDLI